MAIPLISAYFLYFALSNPSAYFCDLQNRSASCTSKEPNPVCAIYSGDECYSATGFCQKTLETACAACMDPSIISYAPGECQESKIPRLCTDYDRNLQCSVEENHVCGYAFSVRFGRQKVYSQPWKNSCDACNPTHVTFHIPGECPDSDNFAICQKSKVLPGCSNQTPSCAYYTGEGCSNKICRKTIQNSCNICDNSSVLFYINGTCENPQSFILGGQVKQPYAGDTPYEFKEFTEESNYDIEQSDSHTYQEIHNQDAGAWKDLPIPKLETVLLPDGSEKILRVEPFCEIPDQPDIPMLEEVLQPDGSTIFERVDNNKDQRINNVEKEDTSEESIELIDSRLLSSEKKD